MYSLSLFAYATGSGYASYAEWRLQERIPTRYTSMLSFIHHPRLKWHFSTKTRWFCEPCVIIATYLALNFLCARFLCGSLDHNVITLFRGCPWNVMVLSLLKTKNVIIGKCRKKIPFEIPFVEFYSKLQRNALFETAVKLSIRNCREIIYSKLQWDYLFETAVKLTIRNCRKIFLKANF